MSPVNHILIADTCDAVHEGANYALAQHGYQLLSASDGAQAISLFASYRQTIAAVVLSVQLPLMNGLAALRRIERLDCNIPIVLTSRYRLDGQFKAASQWRDVPFLSKPFTDQALVELIERISIRSVAKETLLPLTQSF